MYVVIDYIILYDQHLQHKYKILLEPKEKEENHGELMKAPEHLQVAIQAKKEWTLSWMDQFMILSKRTFRARCKDYFDKVRLIQALGVALLLGLLWWKSSINTEAQLRDQVIFLSVKKKKTLQIAEFYDMMHYILIELP